MFVISRWAICEAQASDAAQPMATNKPVTLLKLGGTIVHSSVCVHLCHIVMGSLQPRQKVARPRSSS